MHELTKKDIYLLSEKLGHQFKKEQILLEALTHRSYAKNNNERMEFLGDAILGFIISDWLFNNFEFSEGKLTRIRSNLVCKDSLARIAKDLKLGRYIRLGTGELKTGGHQRDSILADCLEAIIGAIFLDSGVEAAKTCVLSWFREKLSAINSSTTNKDSKTLLQEYLQSKKHPIPVYTLYDVQGTDHNQVFFIECKIDLLTNSVTATGISRKKAEQKCAEQILVMLEKKK
jgi:ribonuclease III